ncbi:alpha/beta hydrolase-fold protein [Luteimonas sp. RD2P54]|uniref:Alpha/beta hydrolase-fold protein n=1 Tax=Luteimonas endophytica TaxID=3042023 RepID=A0ABT6J6R4_9GAMM|nr:alpha/beta hydrolase-fold protein [Luteimonas endophytica]MDH5822505.1 alpha/beta hydrolase-fold protein [Luteimonas endophytica]
MLKNLVTASFLGLMLLAPSEVYGRDGHIDIAIGEEYSFDSSILGEKRAIQVALPSSYAANHGHTRYPVLYLLDGQKFFQMASGVVQHLSADASPRIPEMIVVGIPSEQRVRDSTPSRSLKGPLGQDESVYVTSGGADRFLRFLTDELAPYIDRTYSTSGYRVLAGYSLTGLPVLHALFTQPQAFNSYLAIDPSWWWDDYLLEREARKFIADAKVERRALFVTTTTNNPPSEFFPTVRYVDTLAGMLEAKPMAGLHFGIRVYDDESHHSLALRSLYDGLSHTFEGYAPSLDTLYAYPERLEEQYQLLSRRLGSEVFLREDLVDYFGHVFLHTYHDRDKALLYFRLNTRHYPDSANAWHSLAEGYAASMDRQKAIEGYRRSLELNPENANARVQLQKLLTPVVK